MQAQPGDILIIEGKTVGRRPRRGTIVEVAPGGVAPYRVRWDDGPEGLIYPGPDAHLESVSDARH